MKIEIIRISSTLLARVESEGIVIASLEEALDLLGNCYYQGAQGILLEEKNITPDFFDLTTGIAGEILQKFSTYNMYLAIIGDFSRYSSKSLRDFIYESNKTGRINFLRTSEEAIRVLDRNIR